MRATTQTMQKLTHRCIKSVWRNFPLSVQRHNFSLFSPVYYKIYHYWWNHALLLAFFSSAGHTKKWQFLWPPYRLFIRYILIFVWFFSALLLFLFLHLFGNCNEWYLFFRYFYLHGFYSLWCVYCFFFWRFSFFSFTRSVFFTPSGARSNQRFFSQSIAKTQNFGVSFNIYFICSDAPRFVQFMSLQIHTNMQTHTKKKIKYKCNIFCILGLNKNSSIQIASKCVFVYW